jgi:hypothetical protein
MAFAAIVLFVQAEYFAIFAIYAAHASFRANYGNVAFFGFGFEEFHRIVVEKTCEHDYALRVLGDNLSVDTAFLSGIPMHNLIRAKIIQYCFYRIYLICAYNKYGHIFSFLSITSDNDYYK